MKKVHVIKFFIPKLFLTFRKKEEVSGRSFMNEHLHFLSFKSIDTCSNNRLQTLSNVFTTKPIENRSRHHKIFDLFRFFFQWKFFRILTHTNNSIRKRIFSPKKLFEPEIGKKLYKQRISLECPGKGWTYFLCFWT